jgi:hypothetical protein
MTYDRAHEFLTKRKGKIIKDENPFMLLEDADDNNDAIPDTIVAKGGKVYSFNGYLTKDSDFPLRKRLIGTHNDK